jgi:CPA1 family monovalent cation:H+ antiporter
MYDIVADTLRRFALQRSSAPRPCAHLAADDVVPPDHATCLRCQLHGHAWTKLRMCLTCGAVGCCDSSLGRHARAHFEVTGHPLMRSIEPGERWAWCYPDETYREMADLRP